jgi:hypothetical protein
MALRRGEEPASRPLKVFAFDPSQGRNLNNYMTFHVRYEKVKPGPFGTTSRSSTHTTRPDRPQ